jgi:hypothetical protein
MKFLSAIPPNLKFEKGGVTLEEVSQAGNCVRTRVVRMRVYAIPTDCFTYPCGSNFRGER